MPEQAQFIHPAFIEQTEFQDRRNRLLQKMAPNSIAIVFGEKIKYRNNDTEYPFRQNSDFYYLCGFSEPDAVLILLKYAAEKTTEKTADKTADKTQDPNSGFILFCHDSNPSEEIWTGKRAGLVGAIATFWANQAFDVKELDKIMPTLMLDKTHCYYSLGTDRKNDNLVLSWIKSVKSQGRKGGNAPKKWEDLAPLLHELRLIKSDAEIKLMQTAASISVLAHQRLMATCRPQQMEYHLEAEFLHECIQHGARFLAYPSIVGSGENACILHYTGNDQPLKSGDLVLIDAGCEYQGYASDITRTFPVNGYFSTEQRQIYEVILKAQEAAIALVRPGTLWDALQNTILEVMIAGLIDLKILQGDINQLIASKSYLPFYMHSSGHWLGLDVHDVGAYKVNNEWRTLEPGMVLTIEPGIYMGKNDQVDPKWWDIGVRIEDDILVTKQGNTVLTAALPKAVNEIEALMQASQKK